MKNKRYTGDINGISEHFQFQGIKKKDGSDMTSYQDWVGVIKHLIDNTQRKDNREKIIENPILKNELIGDWDKLLSKYEKLCELEEQQKQINIQAGHNRKEIVLNNGRGKFIPARTGVIQLTLDPRDPKNTEAILKWKEETIKNIQDIYGKDTLISFHFNETSCGAHFIKDWTNLKQVEEDKYIGSIDTKERGNYIDTTKNSNQIIDNFHKRNKETIDNLGRDFKLEVVDGPVNEYSIKRKEKDFVSVCEKIRAGEKLGWKDKRILRKFCEENKIELGEKQVIKVVDDTKTTEFSNYKIEKLRTQLLTHFKDWDENDVREWAQISPAQAIISMIKSDLAFTKETDKENQELKNENDKLKARNELLEKKNKQKTITETKYIEVEKPVEVIKEVRSQEDIKTISNLQSQIKTKDEKLKKWNDWYKNEKIEEKIDKANKLDELIKKQQEKNRGHQR